MKSDALSRLQREAHFHDSRYGQDQRTALSKYYQIAARSHRRYEESILHSVLGNSANVLDYGCGTGETAVKVAAAAASITGIDISPVAVAAAKSRAAGAGLGNKSVFRVMNAEALDFADESFDVVYGTAILHHLDVRTALREVRRVLKPGGTAIFWEPMGHNPFINWYRSRTPEMRTPDEHPLLRSDLRLVRDVFGKASFEYFHFAEVGLPFYRLPIGRNVVGALLRLIDRAILAPLSPIKSWSWVCLIRMTKEPRLGK